MKLPLLLATLGVAATFAQTAFAPTPIDWRYRLTWDDPNLPGLVASWTIYASNSVAVRMSTTRSLSMDLQPLLNGAPAGVYALFGVPTSQLGDMGEAGTNLYVSWPGGNGRIRGPINPKVGK